MNTHSLLFSRQPNTVIRYHKKRCLLESSVTVVVAKEIDLEALAQNLTVERGHLEGNLNSPERETEESGQRRGWSKP